MKSDLPLLVCVDDEQDVLNAITRVFRSLFQVHIFTEASAALNFIKTSTLKVPIVISDFKMSLINGIDFLNQVKEVSPSSIRIILSGQIEVEDLSHSINQQVIHKFFLKPWDNEVLKLQIQEALQTHSLIEEKNRYKRLSITDPITQLTNHRFFQELIRSEIKTCGPEQPLSLLMIDVDHFKSYNDSYGHPEGDKLLRAIADRLKDCISGHPFSLSRYGGEEFTILMPNSPHDQALSFAEKIRENFHLEPFYQHEKQQTTVTLSIGVSTAPKNSSMASELIELADQALYQAKNHGRNKVMSYK